MGNYLKLLILFAGIVLVVFLFSAVSYVEAATLCSYQGPDVSSDLLRLSDFTVSGLSDLKVGDTITVKFTLENYGQYDLNLGPKGIFSAARDPGNLDTSFGFERTNSVLKVGEKVSLEASKVLDKAGSWQIWPSYQIIDQNQEYKLGPDYWHVCSLQVAEKIQDSDQDGVPDSQDNCPQKYNPQQEDIDNDGIGDVCDSCDDRDSDQDKIKNCLDKCPNELENYNQYQDDDGCPDTLITERPGGTITRGPFCGDGECGSGENSDNCCQDCPCPGGQVCIENRCQTITERQPPSPLVSRSGTIQENYIVGFITSAFIGNDRDPFGPGEVFLTTFSATGEKIQKFVWPAQMWIPVEGPERFNQAIPLFAFKESEMGENLAISITAIDNDELPSWLSWAEDLIAFFARVIDSVLTGILSIINSIEATIEELLYFRLELRLEAVRVTMMSDLLVGNEEIGAVNKIYTRAEDWGVQTRFDEPHVTTTGDFRVKYWIGRVAVPVNRDYNYSVNLKNVSFDDTGDWGDGEVWMRIRAFSNFGENGNPVTTWCRIPGMGTWSGGDGSSLNLEGRCSINNLKGPFVFLEISAWDEDNPNVGDDHDLIGEYSTIVLFPDFDLPPVTTTTTYDERIDYPWIIEGDIVTMPFATRRNMHLNFEVSRRLETSP